MKKMFFSAGLACMYLYTTAQELYIFTDPASNIATHSLIVRFTTMVMPMADVHDGKVDRTSFRLSPELMYGIHKNWMVKLSGYAGNMFGPGSAWEGGALYTKYRFYSQDDFHRHLRMAAFGKLAINNNPYQMESEVTHWYPDGAGGVFEHKERVLHSANEQMLEGNHSGWQVGVVATRLVHKLALSATGSFIQRINNPSFSRLPGDVGSAWQGSLSAGYLLFPRQYESYSQTNVNLYVEMIGQRSIGRPGYFLDAAPAVQFILNSAARIDLAWRFQLGGNIMRFNTEQGLIRLEYNFLQAFRKS